MVPAPAELVEPSFRSCCHQLLDLHNIHTPCGSSGLECDWRPFGHPIGLFLQSTLLCHQRVWSLVPSSIREVPMLFRFDPLFSWVGPPPQGGKGFVSCGLDLQACQFSPDFPRVFLFSPLWEDYLSPMPLVGWPQAFLPSGIFDDLLSFQVSIGPVHSPSCFFSRGFVALSEEHVFSHHDHSAFTPLPGLFAGRLRLRLEWSDWSSQGARVLDSMGSFRFHFCAKRGGGRFLCVPSSCLGVPGGPRPGLVLSSTRFLGLICFRESAAPCFSPGLQGF